jgi:curved DNA-binding protein CbpA
VSSVATAPYPNIKSSHRLLSKVYHPDLNPDNEKKAKSLQQRLNQISELISRVSNEELISLLKKGVHKEAKRKKSVGCRR